jgi:hypothetical protein
MDVEPLRDFSQLVRHSRAAGDAGDEAACALQRAFQHGLRSALFPQHVDVDCAAPARDVVGAADLFNGAVTA